MSVAQMAGGRLVAEVLDFGQRTPTCFSQDFLDDGARITLQGNAMANGAHVLLSCDGGGAELWRTGPTTPTALPAQIPDVVADLGLVIAIAPRRDLLAVEPKDFDVLVKTSSVIKSISKTKYSP